jgi:hypothetical protein
MSCWANFSKKPAKAATSWLNGSIVYNKTNKAGNTGLVCYGSLKLCCK